MNLLVKQEFEDNFVDDISTDHNGAEQWKAFSWHCPNCGTIVTGYRNSKGTIKTECNKCHCVMVRITKRRQVNEISIYPPKSRVIRCG